MKSSGNMGQRLQQIYTILLVIVIFVGGFLIGSHFAITEAQTETPSISPDLIGDTDEAFAPLFEVYQIIQDSYLDPVDTRTLVDGAISGMVDSLGDQFSGYMTPDVYEMFDTTLSGDIEGIGVVIRTLEESGEIEVVSVLRGSPAGAVGVEPGDIFVEVDGENVLGLNQTELAGRVRGPAGTDVVITFRRGEEHVTFTITRARIEIPNVETEILPGNIAYISLAEFNGRAYEQIAAAVAELDVNNRSGLIFDLRGNPGGLLSSAVNIASAFIEDGTILTEDFGNGEQQIFEANGSFLGITVPIVVLVDETSASASELVAGAMQDRDVATIIGEVTFGKGTVQNVRGLSNGGGLRITIARWIRPNGEWIHGVGVTPDIVVEWAFDADNPDAEDLQLSAAVEYLQGLGQ